MAYTVSQNFKTAIKDVTAIKSCLVLFADLFFSTSDFTEEGVSFSQYFNVTDDLTYGDCPSDTLSFSVVANSALSGYRFGKAKTFLGVQTESTPFQYGKKNGEDIISYCKVGSNVYCSTFRTFYRNNSVIDNLGGYVSIISDGTYVYAIRENYCARVTDASGAVTAVDLNYFMAQKMTIRPMCAVFTESNGKAYVWDGVNQYTYEYVPMGVYNIVRPRTSFRDVMTIQDAYDNMSMFDKDASSFLTSLKFPLTLGEIYEKLCDYAKVSYDSSTFTYSTTSYSSNPFTDEQCSLRDVLGWIAEKARRIAHFNRTGILELKTISTTVREALTSSDIAWDRFSMANYETPAVTGAIVQLRNGSTLTYVDMENPYVITNNPLITSLTVAAQQAYLAIPTYTPVDLTVLEADPSIDVGDFFTFNPEVNELVVAVNDYAEVYADEVVLSDSDGDALASISDGSPLLARREVYAYEPMTFRAILMHRELQFIGNIRAEYSATGNENRELPMLDNGQTSAEISGGRIDISNADGDQRLTILPPKDGTLTIQPRFVSTW